MPDQPELTHVVAGVLDMDPADVAEDAGPASLERWTSLKHIELVMTLEELYGLRFTEHEIAALRSVRDVRRLLLARGVPV